MDNVSVYYNVLLMNMKTFIVPRYSSHSLNEVQTSGRSSVGENPSTIKSVFCIQVCIVIILNLWKLILFAYITSRSLMTFVLNVSRNCECDRSKTVGGFLVSCPLSLTLAPVSQIQSGAGVTTNWYWYWTADQLEVNIRLTLIKSTGN